ncbi:ATP-dependent RNA helicase Mrh4 [Ophiocordyceps camponoti-floridani]|uniref:ATP-dependent RNA helicase Mrh4 n=1 Tax=Ophiocordyceps camponoti-floridani TaxID=2030778 RepID=A0A8H4VAS4_9HYPO|nr:ATP-dependent RNA helicase Mrh4 [Ophiocordyceps camponoti-floridani]
MPRPKRTHRPPSAHQDAIPSRPRGRPRKTPAAENPQDASVLSARLRRDAALKSLATEDVTTATADDTVSSAGLASTPAGRRGRDTSGLDLADDDVFGLLDDSFAETSGEERRVRPSRRSSVVGRNDAPIRPSSRGPNTPGFGSSFNIGFFRRRPREPSILGTTRKPMSKPTNHSSSSDADIDPDEPNSTPPNSRKRKTTEAALETSSSLSDVPPDTIESDSEPSP